MISARIEQLPSLSFDFSANKSQQTAVGSGRGLQGVRAAEPQRGRVELAQLHLPDVHPDPFVTSLVCCGSAGAKT